MLGNARWPTGVPAQIHYTIGDPFRQQQWIDALVADNRAARGHVDLFDYPGSGHLFTDPSLPVEYDPQATALLWERVLAFCRLPPAPPVAKRAHTSCDHRGCSVNVQFIASVSAIVRDVSAARTLYSGGLDLSFEGGEDGYVFTERLPGVKHFGLWPLRRPSWRAMSAGVFKRHNL